MTTKAPDTPDTPPDDEWRDPDVVFGRGERLSDVGDRRLRDVRSGEPRLKFAWLKVSLMVAFLVGILIFHGEISERAAGCYQHTAGLPDKQPSVESKPPTRHQVQFRVEPSSP